MTENFKKASIRILFAALNKAIKTYPYHRKEYTL